MEAIDEAANQVVTTANIEENKRRVWFIHPLFTQK